MSSFNIGAEKRGGTGIKAAWWGPVILIESEDGMLWRWIKAIVALPVMVLVVIPFVLVATFQTVPSSSPPASPGSLAFWLALGLAAYGLPVAIWTVSLFWLYGEGTAAPWDPPQRFVVRGPYRYVRNPMISAVLALLAAETLMLGSLPILCWLIVALLVNVLYIPLIEERGLAKRFGKPYLTYKKNVPRWLPRFRPWKRE
ncbi:MAG: methyltransferase family protein [Syntrophobacteraceae bacterium]